MKVQLPLDLKVQVAFGAVMAVLLVVGIVANRSVLASFESAQWAQHTDEVLEHLANLRLRIENLENGYRDSALSGTDAFLQRVHANASLADSEQRALRALTADNPHQQRRLSIVADLLQRMVRQGDTIVRLRRTPATEDTAALIRSAQDASLLDAFRIVARDMEAEEQQLLRERKLAAADRYHEAQIALIVGSLAALLIAVVSGWRVARDRNERKGAEDRLKSLNRLYAMVTGISTSMVRVRDRADLFNRSCQTAVRHGEFEMAWIAVIDPKENRIVPDRKSTRLNSSHNQRSRMPSSA